MTPLNNVLAQDVVDDDSAFRYFRAIESEFIRLRVTPLLLSPDDYRIARGWFEAGIPGELVLKTLAELVTRQRDKGQEVRRRLSYYRSAVKTAWQEQMSLAAPGTVEAPTEIDTAGRLTALAAAVSAFPEIAAAIVRLEADPQAESRLGKLEAKLCDQAFARLDEEARVEVERELHAALQVLAKRLPAKSLAKTEQSLRRQVTRRRLDLPVLSLFTAEPESEEL